MPTITANGARIYYEQHGPPGAEVLALSNGVLMSTASWAYQVPDLSRRYRLLLYDCRGMWQSEHPPGPYSMDLHAEDLAALLDGLGVEKAHIGGVSYGAEISMVFALRYPQRTRSLVVASAVSQVDPQLKGVMDSWIAAARRADPDLFFSVTYPSNFSEAWIAENAEVLEAARQRYHTLDMDALLELLLSFSKLDITSRLPEIRAPTLVMVGELDQLKPRGYSELIARSIPGAEFAVLPGAGHAALWERAALFNTLILGFLAKNEGMEGR
jgi:3-oxoadipate enol-lactonase